MTRVETLPNPEFLHVPIPGSAKVAGTVLSIDQLYQPASLIGTAPDGFSWSADGTRLLFLWNDEGYSFHDVWLYSVASGDKTRLTFLGIGAKTDAEVRGVSEAVFLDHDSVAYVLDGKLYFIHSDYPARLVESDKRAIRLLSVSPDQRQLSFVSGTPADSRNRVVLGGLLWARDVVKDGDCEARRIAGEDDLKIYIQDYQWSKDSKSIVFQLCDYRLMPERDIYYYADGELQNNSLARAFPGQETVRARVGIVDVFSLSTRLYERPEARDLLWNYGLSSDSQRLFINSSDLMAKTHTIYMYEVSTAKRETFYQFSDPNHVRPDWRVDWAPLDQGLLILTDRDGHYHLYHQEDGAAEPRQLTTGEWEVATFSVDTPNGIIYFRANKSSVPERQIYRISIEGGGVERVSASTGTHEPVFSPHFQWAADSFTSDTAPPELYLIDLVDPRKQESKRITQSPRELYYRQTWATKGYIEFRSHIDGVQLIGRVLLPADYDVSKRYPLIVGSVYADTVLNQWGGRRLHRTWALDEYLAAHGYIVLNVNVRGSWGQGRDHSAGVLHRYGDVDIDDLESGVLFLVSQGFVDPKRVAVWGSSYGGLMTLMSLAKKPGVYAAGVAGAPASNVAHAYPAQMWIAGPPNGSDMPERYERQSALYQSDGIVDPLMIIHGTRDPVVLFSDTVALTERLIANGQTFELVTLPGAHHAWPNQNLAVMRFAFKKMISFFDRYLQPES